ncbi:MAG TPA: hypothetical protein K8V90_04055 [Romboutsia timonensis]|uniref:Uncharacterized protein n=1 Tax=Romboutsia timonensis TaxID=1776391 RepID=A0A921N0S3_9FIRM|nr:hypothetical protein [Romboutsia timonensis]
MNIFEILLGQIPEAIYFAVFMIFAKRLTEKRLLYVTLMIVEYLLLKQLLSFTVWFQVAYTFITFIILKFLYKEKSQLTDIFTFCISSVCLMLINAILFFTVCKYTSNYILYVIIDRIGLFLFLLCFNNKLYKIQGLYKLLWNRNDNKKKPIKSTTFRCINLVIFNTMFYVLNMGMIYCIYLRNVR